MSRRGRLQTYAGWGRADVTSQKQPDQAEGRPATMKDIAKAAGVAQSTVSRILNDTPLRVPISRETRERVLAAAAELRYRPNPHARGLRGAPTMLLGAIVRDVTDPFFAGAIDALSLEARNRGYRVVLGHARERADEALALAAILEARQCDAIVIVGDLRNQPRLLEDLESVHLHVPVVAVWHGAHHDGFLTVNVDNHQGIAVALRHLTGLGHRRIAFIGDPILGDIQERQAAYEDFLRAKRLAVSRGYIQHVRNTFADGVAAFEALMALPEPPSAVAAATDVLAIGVLHAASEQSLAVPDELSVVGFDDIPFAAMTVPALTTVRMPVEQMIRAAVEMAIDKNLRNAGGTARGVRVFEPTLVVRRSTARPARR
jgi:DNA-binding LacI/PurR family transcriptional regulator